VECWSLHALIHRIVLRWSDKRVQGLVLFEQGQLELRSSDLGQIGRLVPLLLLLGLELVLLLLRQDTAPQVGQRGERDETLCV
jgi:hypothetical protein